MKEISKNRVAERILNHSLGIIYLLTGEEYIVVKKNTPHNSIHLLTGDVPITCGDVSVYFSMEEWDYIEGHKEIYQDVITENKQNFCTKEIPENRSSGLPVEHLDPGSVGSMSEEKENEREERGSQQVETLSDSYAGEINAEIILKVEHVEELCVKGRLEDQKQERDGNSGTVESIGREEDESMKITVLLKESHTEDGTSNAIVEDDTRMRQQFQEDTGGIPANSPDSCEMVNLTPNFEYSKSEQTAWPPNGRIDTGSHTVARKDIKIVAGKKIRRDFDYTRKIPAFSDHKPKKGKKSHRCNECGKYFAFRCHLKTHQNSHTKEKSFNCEVCGKQFPYKSSLLKHSKTHTGDKPHRCNICGKQFSYRSGVIIHQRIHTGEKPYTCTECGKQFSTKAEFTYHQSDHTGDKPFLCIDCGKRFANKSNFTEHRRIHTGERPYVCTECGKSFAQRSTILMHQKSHRRTKLISCQECGRQLTSTESVNARHCKKCRTLNKKN